MSEVHDEKLPNLTQYTHHSALEETAQGLRFHGSVFANDKKTAIDELFALYQAFIDKCNGDPKYLRAPMEIKEKKPSGGTTK